MHNWEFFSTTEEYLMIINVKISKSEYKTESKHDFNFVIPTDMSIHTHRHSHSYIGKEKNLVGNT